MAFGDRDLDIFFRDGSTVVGPDGVTTFNGHLDWPEEIVDFSGLSKTKSQQGQPVLRCATAAAAGLKRNDRIVVDGQAFRLAGVPRKVGDGLESVLDLNKAEE